MLKFKRIMSFLLTVTLLAGMIPPVQVRAEEMQTPVETMAVETTVAAEETETSETTEAVEQTEVTETTAAAETEVPETVVTEETESALTEEIVVAEILDASQEAADAAISGECARDLTWTLDNGVLTVSGIGEMFNWNSSSYVPWNSYRNQITKVILSNGITQIGSLAFYECRNLEEVIIPDTVTYIGDGAFQYCEGITSVELPENLEYIGKSAFCETGITAVEIPAKVHNIREYAFSRCESLEEIGVSEQNQKYSSRNGVLFSKDGTYLYQYPGGKTGAYTIPEGVTEIKASAFYYCTGLTNMTFPETLQFIGASAFSGCTGLTKLEFPSRLWRIDEFAFSWCDLEYIKFGSNLYSFLDYAFSNTTIGAIYYGGTVEDWKENQFGSSNTAIANNSNIYYQAYGSCGENVKYDIKNGVLTICGTGPMTDYPDKTISSAKKEIPWYSSKSKITEIVVEDGVTTIGNYAFYECNFVNSVSIGKDVTVIGKNAFYYCNEGTLAEIVLPQGLTTIRDNAFWGCTKLTAITIPEGVTSVGESAFQYCTRLQSITFLGDFPNMAADGDQFYNVRNLLAYYPAGNTTWTADKLTDYGGSITWRAKCFNGHTEAVQEAVAATCTKPGLTAGKYCSACNEVLSAQTEIPATGHSLNYSGICINCGLPAGTCGSTLYWMVDGNVLTIYGSGDMYNYGQITKLTEWYDYRSQITTVVVENGVAGIGEYAFNGCTGITQLELPDTVTRIGLGAFYGCKGMAKIELSDTLKSISKHAFYNCTALKEIVIPDSVTSVSSDAFYGCQNLKIFYEGTVREWTLVAEDAFQVTCADGVAYKWGSCGDNVRWTLSLDGVLTIFGSGQMDAFSAYTYAGWNDYRNDIITVVVEEGITSIGAYAFSKCSALTAVELPESISTIGSNVFGDCTSLAEVVLPENLTNIPDGCFDGCTNLQSVSIPRGVKSVGKYAFEGCAALAEIELPENIKEILNGCFDSCTSLETVKIPATVTKIAEYGFRSCSGLRKIIFTGNLPAIDSNAFKNVTSCAYYPLGNNTWNSDALKGYGGTLTWIARCVGAHTEVIDEAVAPTCTKSGLTEGKHCSVCGEVIIAQTEVPSTGHTEVIDSAVAPTCTETGLTEGKHCSVCGETTKAQTEVPSTGHTEVIDSAVAPTCTETGLTEGKHCSVCGETTQAQTEVPSTGHTEVIDPAAAPTCTETGLTEGKHCSVCGETTQAQTEVPSTGHTEVIDPAEAPTCTETGLTEGKHCSVCGEVLVAQNEIPAGHNIVNGSCTGCHMVGSCGEGLSWTLSDDGVLTISGTGEMDDWIHVDRVPWKADDIQKVVINNGVTSIGDNAFSGCSGLTEITLPAGMTRIGSHAFYKCNSLAEITIPSEVTSIGDMVFFECESLTKIGIPEGVTAIPDGAFDGCIGLKQITVPSTVTSIGVYAFCRCRSLTDITLPLGVTSIEDFVFDGCISLTEVKIPVGVDRIGDYAFSGCIGLKEITIPSGVTCIEREAFRDCNNLTEITFEGDAPAIAKDVFLGVNATAYYHYSKSWTADVLQGYGGTIRWENISCKEHVPVIDPAVAPTCTATGLTEGKHCSVCSEVIIAQRVVGAYGHDYGYVDGEDFFICGTCGEDVTVTAVQEYILLRPGEEIRLRSILASDEAAENLEWILEENNGVVTLTENDKVIARKDGSVYVYAKLDGISTIRCRIEVAGVQVEDIHLSTDKLTSELYSTAYARLKILLQLPQEKTAQMDAYSASQSAAMAVADLEDNGISIEEVVFTNTAMRKFFEPVIRDDRWVDLVPTQYAVDNPKLVAKSYKTAVTVTIRGKAYTSESMTLTVKKTVPKLKATIPAFNSFYSGDFQKIAITGGTVENIASTSMPSWLSLNGDVLTLTKSAPQKSTSGKVYLMVKTEEWVNPILVTLSVKNTYKAPKLKLDSSSITVAAEKASEGVALNLMCSDKKQTLSGLEVTGITAQSGYRVENFNAEDGSFLLKANKGFQNGKVTMTVRFGNTTRTVTVTLTVKVTQKAPVVKLKTSTTKLTLNKVVAESAVVGVSCSAKGYALKDLSWQLMDKTGKNSAEGRLDISCSANKLTVKANNKTEYGATYKLILKSQEYNTTATVTVTIPAAAKSRVTVTLKASGKLDVIRDGSAVTVTPTYKNYKSQLPWNENLEIYSSADNYKKPVTNQFCIESNGAGGYRITKAEGKQPSHSYKYKVKLISTYGNTRVESALTAISVTMGSAKLTMKSDGAILFAKDTSDRTRIWFTATDAALNDVVKVEIKDAKYRDMFEVIDYGSGQFAIAYKDNNVHEKLIGKKSVTKVSLTLNVFLEGNRTSKVNTTAKLALTVVK